MKRTKQQKNENMKLQDRQCRYNVKLRRVGIANVAGEMQ